MEDFEKVLPVIAKSGPADDKHESKCERCGVGCHATVNINGHDVVVEGLHCKFLEDTGEGPLEDLGRGRFQCSVYEDRMEVAPWCGHTDYAKDRGWLRKGCPYVSEDFSGGKERLPPNRYDNLWPHILKEVLATEWHEHTSHTSFVATQLSKREPGDWQVSPGSTEGTVVFDKL